MRKIDELSIQISWDDATGMYFFEVSGNYRFDGRIYKVVGYEYGTATEALDAARDSAAELIADR